MIKIFVQESQKLFPQQGMTTASFITFLQIGHWYSMGMSLVRTVKVAARRSNSALEGEKNEMNVEWKNDSDRVVFTKKIQKSKEKSYESTSMRA